MSINLNFESIATDEDPSFRQLEQLAENTLATIDRVTMNLFHGIKKSLHELESLQNYLALIRERIPKKIGSLNEMPPPSSNPGILAVDLDGVLIIRDSLLGSIPWYFWMARKNQENNRAHDWHHPYQNTILNKFPNRLVEDAATVEKLFTSYRNAGWKVVILTARHPSTTPAENLKICGIPFLKEDFICTSGGPKGPALLEWKEARFDPEQHIEIRFIDDQELNIQSLHTCKTVHDMAVECFYYINPVQSEPWSQKQLEKMACQLFGLYNCWPDLPSLEEPTSPSTLNTLKKIWQINKIDEDTLYNLLVKYLPKIK